jgi:hypothetical protein
MCRRKVKSQRGQCVQDAEVAGVLAVQGLNTDDAHHDGGGHTVFTLGPLQGALVGLPKTCAGLDALRFDEAGAVGGPVLGHGCGGRQHEFFDHGDSLCLCDLLLHPGFRKVEPLGSVLCPEPGVFTCSIRGACGWRFVGFADFGFGLGVSAAVFFVGRAGSQGRSGQHHAASQKRDGVRKK